MEEKTLPIISLIKELNQNKLKDGAGNSSTIVISNSDSNNNNIILLLVFTAF